MIPKRDLPRTLNEDMLGCFHEVAQDKPKLEQEMLEMHKFHDSQLRLELHRDDPAEFL